MLIVFQHLVSKNFLVIYSSGYLTSGNYVEISKMTLMLDDSQESFSSCYIYGYRLLQSMSTDNSQKMRKVSWVFKADTCF